MSRVGTQQPRGSGLAAHRCFKSDLYHLDGLGITCEVDKGHLRAIDRFFRKGLADWEGHSGLIFILLAYCDAILVALGAGRSKSMQKL